LYWTVYCPIPCLIEICLVVLDTVQTGERGGSFKSSFYEVHGNNDLERNYVTVLYVRCTEELEKIFRKNKKNYVLSMINTFSLLSVFQ